MKGFPEQVEGPMGPWYQKVNAALAKARLAKTLPDLRGLLGEPDEVLDGDEEDRRKNANDPRYPEFIWVYLDPYRRGIEYHFNVAGGRVMFSGKVRRIGVARP